MEIILSRHASYGVTSYDSGWSKDVVNWCLDEDAPLVEFMSLVFTRMPGES